MEIFILIVVLVLNVMVAFGLFMLNEMNQTLDEIKYMVEDR